MASETAAMAGQPEEPHAPGETHEPPTQAEAQLTVDPIVVDEDDQAEVQLALKNLEERRKRNRRKRIVKIVVACVIAAAAIAAWLIVNALNEQRQKEEAEAASAALGSMIETASPGIQASGTLKPGSSVLVTPEVSGIIQEVKVTEGQHVEAGDVLFTMKSDEAEKSLADAQTAIGRAQRNVTKAQSGAAQAQRDYDSAVGSYNAAVAAYNNSLDAAAAAGAAAYDSIYQQAMAAIPSTATEAERKALVAQAEAKAQAAYDEAYAKALATDPGSFDHSGYAASIDAANDSVTTAQEALDDAQKDYERAQAQLAKCQVKAPRAGTVLSCKAIVGASVGGASGGTSSGEASVLIGDLSTLEVDIEVNEIDVSGVKVGQAAEVTFPAFAEMQEEAEVVSVAAAATSSASDSAGSGGSGGGIVTFTVKLVIKHPDERLKAGMSVNVRILAEDDVAATSAEATVSTSAVGTSADAAPSTAGSGGAS